MVLLTFIDLYILIEDQTDLRLYFDTLLHAVTSTVGADVPIYVNNNFIHISRLRISQFD